MTSTVPAFKTALKSRLRAALSCDVFNGDPGLDKMGDSVVLIGPAKGRQLEFVCGMTQANETYDVEVMASVVGPKQSTHESLLALAYGINEDIVGSVLSWKDADYGGIVNVVMPSDSSDDEAVGDGWREAIVTQTFHVTGRI